MAALYSGIHLKLKSPKTPWRDKLKIAHFAWISQQCVLPNKEQVLLDWVTHTLIGYHTKKLELEEDVVEKLWVYFENVVHSKKLHELLKSGKTINLRFAVAQVINDGISEYSTLKAQKVLSCCKAILSNPSLAVIYTAKGEMMVELLKKLSLVTCQALTSQEPLTTQLFDVLLLTVNQYLLMQRQQVNANRVFGHMTDHLIQHCLLLRHLLSCRTWAKDEDSRLRQQMSKEIRIKIEFILQTGLFQAELLASYREELLSGEEPQDKRGPAKTLLTPVQIFMSKLCEVCTGDDCLQMTVIANSVPLLYKLFLDSYCKEGNQLLCFHMVTRLFDCLPIFHLGQNDDALLQSNWSVALLAAEQLLNSVLDHDIYNVAVDRIRHEEVQFKFYRRLAELLVNKSQPSIPAWFRCLRSLVLLNHLILEQDLDDLVSSAWIDADITDTRVKKAQEVLISTLLQTYTKLRQFPRLFEEVLAVICRPAFEELRQPILSPNLSLKVYDCLHELPPNQILDIWDLILEKCCSLIIRYVKEDSDMALKLLSMSSLLHSILFNMKCLDNTTPLLVIHRTQKLMEGTLRDLIRPLLNLHQDHPAKCIPPLWLEKVNDSALLLSYTWVEVNTMLSLNCSQYHSAVCEQAAPEGSPMMSWDFAALIPVAECWKTVVACSCKLNSMGKYCLERLSLLKMKKIFMQKDIQSDTFLQSLRNAASFVLDSGTTGLIEGEINPWNCAANSVGPSTYPVAHWHLVVSHLPILVPYLSTDDLTFIADMLLKTLASPQVATDSENPDLYVTLSKVSTNLLHSSCYLEVQGLHRSLVTCLIRHCGRIVKDNEDHALGDLLCQLSAENIPWQDDPLSFCEKVSDEIEIACKKPPYKSVTPICWETMKNVSENILSLAKVGSTLGLEEDQLEYISSLLGVISAIKPDSLMPVDRTRCFLLLLSLATRVRGKGNCSMSKTLHLQKTCYHLLVCLQSGIHATSVFKAMHASDILEVSMSSLFAAGKYFSGLEHNQDWIDLLSATQTFLGHFFQIINRKQSLLINLEKFSLFLENCKPYLDATSNKNSSHLSLHTGQLLLVALSTVCRITIPYLQEHDKDPTSETLCALLQQIILEMGTIVKLTLHETTSNPLLPSFFVTCVTTLLEAELSVLSYCSNKYGQSNSESFTLSKNTRLQHAELYRVFYSQIVKVICSAGDHIHFVKSALHFLTFYCSVTDHDMTQERINIFIFGCLQKLLAGAWMTFQKLEPELIGLLSHLLKTCTPEEFYVMMKHTLQGIEVHTLWKQSDQEVLSAIGIIKLVLSCQLSRDSDMFFWSTIPQIMTALGLLTMEACQDESLISSLIVPVLELVALMLMKGEGIIQNPHHVTLAFDILLSVPLDRLRKEDYYSVFRGCHEVLFSILQYHPKAMLKAVPSFLNCFNRLVTSVMHEGRQGEKGASSNFASVLKCAQLVERMYTHIAAKTEEFTVLSAFIISQHVNELQKVTLHPEVKKHLSEGIYHILDICIERDVRFLNASLQMGVRELLKEIYSDYKHYHKLKNLGEKKYTA
ncbi:unhealthy ribosome biogenesis protein 2 homolog isoform X2 [Ambystoma mexicanum]|uniref:unhealthy ribosome biogenesis protein 2 homolog isoform X2 n=1 Tax=Ambystoma mexicanum TaxID=8296 RepID=UPI0037E9BF60